MHRIFLRRRGGQPEAAANGAIDFRTEPARYRHWKLATDGEVATLTMDVDEKARPARRL